MLILKLSMTLYQRKYNDTGSKMRVVSLLQSIYIGSLYVVIIIVKEKELPEFIVYCYLFLIPGIGYIFRKSLFPYKRRCLKCKEGLKISQILFEDSHLCKQCDN